MAWRFGIGLSCGLTQGNSLCDEEIINWLRFPC